MHIYHYCIDLLSRRAYSTFKLARKLKQKKYTPEEITLVLQLLTNEKYLRDDLYAEARVRTWMNKGDSTSQIQRKLRMEKLSLSMDRIQEIFKESDRSEEMQVSTLVATQLRKNRKAPPTEPRERFKFKQKVIASVMRKGHSFQIVKIEVERALAASAD